MSWDINRLFKPWQKASKEKRIMAAYKEVFGNSEAATLVLNDLMNETGYFSIPAGVDGQELACFEGRRSIGYHIVSQLNPTEKDLSRLNEAARYEYDVGTTDYTITTNEG